MLAGGSSILFCSAHSEVGASAVPPGPSAGPHVEDVDVGQHPHPGTFYLNLTVQTLRVEVPSGL